QDVLNAIPRARIRRAGPAGAQFAAGEAAAPADASVGRAWNAAHAPTPTRPIIAADARPQSGARLRGRAQMTASTSTVAGRPATSANTTLSFVSNPITAMSLRCRPTIVRSHPSKDRRAPDIR